MPLPQFPVNNIANAKKARLVYAICRRTEDGSGWDPVKWAWWNTATEAGDTAHASFAAAEAHYDGVLTAPAKAHEFYAVNPLIAIFRDELRRDRAAIAAAVGDDL